MTKPTVMDHLFTDRVVNASQTLKDNAVKVGLLVFGFATVAAAAIGTQFFQMDRMVAGITAGSGGLMLASALTERDAFISLLAIGAITGTTVATVQAFRDGRFFVHLDLVELLKLGMQAWSK